MNFFRVLRDQKERLVEAIGLTPFSREEFYRAVSANGNAQAAFRPGTGPAFFREGQTGKNGPGADSVSGAVGKLQEHEPRRDVRGRLPVARECRGTCPKSPFASCASRLRTGPPSEVVQLYDDKETLFYCDPPYVHSTRGDKKAYGFEMKDAEHRDLARVLSRVKGKVAVSGYKCDLMDESV